MPSDLDGGDAGPRAAKDRPMRAPLRRPTGRHVRASWAALTIASLVVFSAGCVMVGPDYRRPDAPVADDWRDGGEQGNVRSEAVDLTQWWKIFGDPVLDSLIESAYRNNPTLQSAGARVMEAVARRRIAYGNLFPQQQEAFGTYTHFESSENTAAQPRGARFDQWELGFDATWELDIWGRLRRGVEAADAEVLASIATYDDVLVTLIAEVARNFILLRTFEERLVVAEANVGVQEDSFRIADARFRSGAVSQLDAAQATSLLEDTRALIPDLEASIRQTENTLCILLGMAPHDLHNVLGAGPRETPKAPREIAIGIPADLLRRRPDVRRAERILAAQSAQIGIAKGDLLPAFTLTGTIELTAEHASDLFKQSSLAGFAGPRFRWAILNYGRITNNVRAQDAAYQALVGDYEDTVLRAQAEVENAIAAFLGAQRRVDLLGRSVKAAQRAVDVAYTQYREGAADYTRVLNTQQFLVDGQDRLVTTKGDVALGLTALYKALGGGWEVRDGDSFVTPEQVDQMRERTNWGNMLDDVERRPIDDPARSQGNAAPPGVVW